MAGCVRHCRRLEAKNLFKDTLGGSGHNPNPTFEDASAKLVGNPAFWSDATADPSATPVSDSQGSHYDTVQQAREANGHAAVRPSTLVAAIYSEFNGPVKGSDTYMTGIVSAQSKIIQRMKIDAKAVELGELLGGGMFGQVHSGTFVSDGTKVAVKTIKGGLLKTQTANTELATEAALTVCALRLVVCVRAWLHALLFCCPGVADFFLTGAVAGYFMSVVVVFRRHSSTPTSSAFSASTSLAVTGI